MKHQFGGDWTQNKLQKLGEYINAYVTALKFQQFELVYVDAFAGSGAITLPDEDTSADNLFDSDISADRQGYIDGSAVVALRQDPPFHRYVFIEKNRRRAKALEDCAAPYRNARVRIDIKCDECNASLRELCEEDWTSRRALVFLDPYGMELEWTTLELLASTRKVDILILIPHGIGANRLLVSKPESMDPTWKESLIRFYGTDEFLTEAYKEQLQSDLFEDPTKEKVWNETDALRFYLRRMQEIFAYAHPEPLILRSSKNTELFALGFALANHSPKAIALAKRLIENILR